MNTPPTEILQMPTNTEKKPLPTRVALSTRDARILALHKQGLSNPIIAQRVGLSKDRVGAILRRLASLHDPS